MRVERAMIIRSTLKNVLSARFRSLMIRDRAMKKRKKQKKTKKRRKKQKKTKKRRKKQRKMVSWGRWGCCQ